MEIREVRAHHFITLIGKSEPFMLLSRDTSADNAVLLNQHGEKLVVDWSCPVVDATRLVDDMIGPTLTMLSGSMKGVMGGICNRSACNHGNARHYNISTRSWYCTPCARSIQEHATNAHQMVLFECFAKAQGLEVPGL
jgi:hypothetical protein